MKTKKFNKRFMLNKKTVANLNNDDMKVVHGGDHVTEDTLCVRTVHLTKCASNCWCTRGCY